MIEDVLCPEVRRGAPDVHEADRAEATIFPDVQLDSPITLADEFAAAPAARSARGVVCGSGDADELGPLEPAAGHSLELGAVFDRVLRGLERSEEFLGALACTTAQMEPPCRLALTEGVGLALAEAKVAACDRLPTSAAVRPATFGRFDDVRHRPAG